jgi:hypothetical protein
VKAICIILGVAIFLLISAMVGQRKEASALRKQINAEADLTVTDTDREAKDLTEETQISPEIIRLRGQVTGLTRRRAELQKVRDENTHLKDQLALRHTVSPGAGPQKYIKQSEAAMVGYGSPEATLQTWLWSMRTHNRTHFLQAFTADYAEKISAEFSRQGVPEDAIFKSAEGLVGLGITNQIDLPDGSKKVQFIVSPDLPSRELKFHLVGGEWKMSLN